MTDGEKHDDGPHEAGEDAAELMWNPDATSKVPAAEAQLPDDGMKSWSTEGSRILTSMTASAYDATNMSASDTAPAKPRPSAVSLSTLQAATGNFTFLKQLGLGGFGEVWEAMQLRLGRRVAVKVVRQDFADKKDSENYRHNFVDVCLRQEALTAASLDHPNIVPVYDLQQDERGFPALAMKLVQGQPWEDVLRQDFEMYSPADLLAKHLPILLSVAQAVAFAHSRGVLHRDLKPSQVMIGEYGEVLLMDWGLGVVYNPAALAKTLHNAANEIMPTLVSASSPAGTVTYMAPEQTERTATNVGPWTDVYLLGGILYTVLTGCRPHGTGSVEVLYDRATKGEIVPLNEAAPGRPMPGELVELCRRALIPAPTKRLQTAREFLDALVDYQSGAGRRTKALELMHQANALRNDGKADYATLSQCDELLRRSRDLWPDNDGAVRLSQLVCGDFAEAALSHGDLQLARIHTERLENVEVRGVFEARIAQAEGLRRRRERERRVATIAAFAAMLVIVVGTLIFNRQLAETSRAVRRAQDDSERLIASLQDNLYPDLEAIGQMKPLSTLGDDVDQYFTSMDQAAMSPYTQQRHLNSLLSLRRVKARMGETTSAVGLAERAVAMAAKLQQANGNQAEYMASLVSARCALAQQLYMVGTDVRRASETAHLAVLDLQQLAGMKFTNARQMSVTAGAAEELSTLLFILDGDARSSKSLLDSSSRLRQISLQANPTDEVLLDGMAVHYVRLAQYQIGCGELEGALLSLAEARGIRSKLAELATDNFANQRELARVDFFTGRAYERLGMSAEAIMHHREALRLREAQAQRDDDDLTLRWNLAVSRAKVAELELDQGNAAYAEKELSATLAILNQAPSGAAGNRDLASARASTLLAQGRLREQQGDSAGAVRNWQESVEILQRLERSAPYEYFTLRVLTEGLLKLDRVPEAERAAEKLRKLGYRGAALSRMLEAKGLRPL